jgi:hypothetical protein
MIADNSKAAAVATIITVAVFAAAFLSMSNSDVPLVNEPTSEITSLTICGNSSDLLYPELAEASFVILEPGSWLVIAQFVDDSEGPEEPEIYDRNFTVISEDMKSISDALYGGLNQTRISEDSVQILSERSPSIWYDMEFTYADGSWVYIATFQTSPGYIIFNHGKGTPDRNLLNGTVLEPLSALDSLVSAIYAIFSNHLE